MPIGVVTPQGVNPTSTDAPSTNWLLRAAGTYDLVALDPSGQKRCAKKIVALAGDAGWTIEDANGNSNGPIAVPALFAHTGHTRGITCASPIAIYY